MSIESPVAVLVDSDGNPVGTPTNALFVSGTVAVSNMSAVQAVTGSVSLSAPITIGGVTAPLPVTGSLSVGTSHVSVAVQTNVSAIRSSQQLLSPNANRSGAVLVNDSPGVAYVLFGSGSQFNAWTYRMLPLATIELGQPVYVGTISAIWTKASGSMMVTELFE